jgi:hypothetical protein
MLMRLIVLVITFMFLLVLGISCVFFATKTQAYYLRSYDERRRQGIWGRYLASNAYLWNARIVGFAALGIAIVCLYFLITNMVDLLARK